MGSKLYVSGIVEESIVDGEGLRFVVFAQGCTHNCLGCHNPQTHKIGGGICMSVETLERQILENPLLDGVTFSGGEPFLQPGPLAALARRLKAAGLDITTYTGYVYEELLRMARRDADVAALLSCTDVLIDGPYVEEMKDLALTFRGSSNQRIIKLCERREAVQTQERAVQAM